MQSGTHGRSHTHTQSDCVGQSLENARLRSHTVRLKHKTGIPVTAPRWQSSAQRIRLQSGTPAGSNPALGSHTFL